MLFRSLSDELWGRLRRMARLLYRRVPVGVTLVRTDGSGSASDSIVVRQGQPMVTVSGPALELVLRSYGRRAVRVEVQGDADACAAFEQARLSI